MGTLGRERALSTIRETFDLEEWGITVYAALKEAGVVARDGKRLPRPGPAPDVDDREVLCLAVLQELLGFESDHAFYQWLESDAVLRQLFPLRLTRSDRAERRALLTPLLQRLSQAFCALDGEEAPPLFIIDSHPVDVCRPIRTGHRERLGGLAQRGYCASLERRFHALPRAPGVHTGRPDLHPTVHSLYRRCSEDTLDVP